MSFFFEILISNQSTTVRAKTFDNRLLLARCVTVAPSRDFENRSGSRVEDKSSRSCHVTSLRRQTRIAHSGRFLVSKVNWHRCEFCVMFLRNLRLGKFRIGSRTMLDNSGIIYLAVPATRGKDTGSRGRIVENVRCINLISSSARNFNEKEALSSIHWGLRKRFSLFYVALFSYRLPVDFVKKVLKLLRTCGLPVLR